jgi:hypothetical protein
MRKLYSQARIIRRAGYRGTSCEAVGVNINSQVGMKGAVSVRTILAALRSHRPDADVNKTSHFLIENINPNSRLLVVTFLL